MKIFVCGGDADESGGLHRSDFQCDFATIDSKLGVFFVFAGQISPLFAPNRTFLR